MGRFIDLRGKRFGRLLVIERRENNKFKQVQWACRCDCGAETVVIGYLLRYGETKSCGCLQRDIVTERNITHGDSKTPEHNTWSHIKSRCYNEKGKPYPRYGGRGIKVCDRWLGANGYVNFLADMGRKPSPEHSIERMQNDGDYCPENCKWALPKEQARNRENNVYLTHGGETLLLAEWADRLGIDGTSLRKRLEKWPLDRALSEPPRKQQHSSITYQGRTMSVPEWAEELGVHFTTLYRRLKENTVEDAFRVRSRKT